jgi:DNA-binding response OmpR family regulator
MSESTRSNPVFVLLVGDDSPLLEILSGVLSKEGYTTDIAHCAADVKGYAGRPDVVIFEHLTPLDLYALNPREYGFEGPLLLLSEEPSTCAEEVLDASRTIRKPLTLEQLRRVLLELIADD